MVDRAVAPIHTQGIGNLYRTCHRLRQRHDISSTWHSAYLRRPAIRVGNTYMRGLYDVGYELAAQGVPWMKERPG